MAIQWWCWIVLGCVLCLAELVVPALILIWLGIAALLTGLFLLFVPVGLTAQLAFWGLLSIAMTIAFLRYFKPRIVNAGAGRSDEIINEIGLITRPIEPWSKGEILFQKPLLGADRWSCMSEQTIGAGERARVISVEGSALRVLRL